MQMNKIIQPSVGADLSAPTDGRINLSKCIIGPRYMLRYPHYFVIDWRSETMTSEEISARTVMERCNILGGYSEEPDCLIRPFASRAMRQANEAVATWMQAAGMTIQQDAIGNLIGRYDALAEAVKTLLLGSILDSGVDQAINI